MHGLADIARSIATLLLLEPTNHVHLLTRQRATVALAERNK